MAFKATEWEFSNESERTFVNPEPGVQYLQITDASFDKELGHYNLSLLSLSNEATFTLRYFMNANKPGPDGSIRPNFHARNTLLSLGKALAGKSIGIPFPPDIIGGVVLADVQIPPREDGRQYARIDTFCPVDESMAPFSTIDQYYTGGEE